MNHDDSFIRVSYLHQDGVRYKIGITQKKANKRTRILCEGNAVIWRQIHPLGISPAQEDTTICQPGSFMEPGHVCLLVIAGTPDSFIGLDEGRFLSVQAFDRRIPDKLYVMSEKGFSKLPLAQ